MLISLSGFETEFEKDKRVYEKGNIACWFKGYYFFENKYYESHSAANHIISRYGSYELEKNIPDFNGIFSAVIINRKTQTLKIITDRIAPSNLFYSKQGNSFYLSDDIYKIKSLMGRPQINIESAIEFLHFRFVSGKYTLFKDIYCTTPALILDISIDGRDINISSKRYWDYDYSLKDYSIKEAENKCYTILNEIIERFKSNIFNEKSIGLNLSGGFDSRTILGLLLQNNIKQLKFFTFGHPSCDDIIYTEQIRKQFDLNGHVVSDLNIYDKLFDEKFIQSLTLKIGHHCYYFQGYITQLFEKQYENIQYLLTGDIGFTIGLLIKDQIHSIKSNDEMIHLICRKNGHLKPVEISRLLNFSVSPELISKIIQKRIKEAIGDTKDYSLKYYKWYQENRLRKYALSSFDLYSEYTKVLYPFFDHHFHDFMFTVPHTTRRNQRVYLNTIAKHIFKNELKPLSQIPYQGRGKYRLNKINEYAPIKKNRLNMIIKMLNPFTKNYRLNSLHPISYLWSKQNEKYLENIDGTINFNSKIINKKYLNHIIRKRKKNHMFIQYGLLILLSLITFEKINPDCKVSDI
tara:strand:+ start:1193 stop:2920 length:1728 start_codon:yes stop_codon:yes gene_type:complete